MDAVILCGGLGTRLSEQTQLRPKPMVEIGGRPILWHIMKMYERHGVTDFTLALGYRGEAIKDYFLNYHARRSNMTVNLGSGVVEYSDPGAEDWRVSLVDTGLDTMTGGRLLRLKARLKDNGTFMLTYGDGLSDLNLTALLEFHRSHGRVATVTAVRAPARFGRMLLGDRQVLSYTEKVPAEEGWINGGFYVFQPEVFDHLEGDDTVLEQGPLEALVSRGELMAYEHSGYWQCMDTIRDRDTLQGQWDAGAPPWVGGAP